MGWGEKVQTKNVKRVDGGGWSITKRPMRAEAHSNPIQAAHTVVRTRIIGKKNSMSD